MFDYQRMKKNLAVYYPQNLPIHISDGYLKPKEYEKQKHIDIRYVTRHMIRSDMVFSNDKPYLLSLVVVKNNCNQIVHCYISKNHPKYSFKNIKLYIDFYDISHLINEQSHDLVQFVILNTNNGPMNVFIGILLGLYSLPINEQVCNKVKSYIPTEY